MYEWIKALHIIAVISWMAGMLYLPRLFVYHCGTEAGSNQSETFKVMERRQRELHTLPVDRVEHERAQPRDDRDVGRRTLSRMERALVFVRLAVRKAFARNHLVGCPRSFFPVREGFRRRPEYAK